MNHTIQIDKAPKGVWITLDNDIRVKFQRDEHSLMEVEIPEQLSVSSSNKDRKEDRFAPAPDHLQPAGDVLSRDVPSKASYSPRSIPESSFWVG